MLLVTLCVFLLLHLHPSDQLDRPVPSNTTRPQRPRTSEM
jgi:hypothetical protein